MSYSGDIALSNTFDITIKNNSPSRQEVSMFELGSNNPNRILPNIQFVSQTPTMVSAGQNNPYSVPSWNLSPQLGGIWIRLNSDGEAYITYKYDITLFFKNSQQITITSLGGQLQTLEQDLNAINNALENSVPTPNPNIPIKYARLQLAPIYFTDPDTGNPDIEPTLLAVTVLYLTANPITGINDGTYFRESDFNNPQLFNAISINPQQVGLPSTAISSLNLWDRTGKNTSKNGAIEVPNNAGTPYNQILESQNGQVLDIKSMRIDAFSNGVPNQANIISQLSEPLIFSKLDSNDNRLVYNKIPTVDPYQFQNTIDYINMKTKADTYALDGNTSFATGIQANTSMRLTCAYTQLTNLTATSEYAKEYEQKQADNIERQIEENDSRRNYKLKIPTKVVESIENQNKKEDLLEKKNKIWNENLSLQIQNLSVCWVSSISHIY